MTGTTVDLTPEQRESTRYASRKFIFAAFLILFASAAFWAGKLSESGYITICTLVFTGYCVANVAQKKGESS